MDVRHYQRFGELIKALRREHRLSQRALARALSVSAGYVGQWELGLSQPSVSVAAKICSTFNIDDVEYVNRLAYAARAPEWLRESIVRYRADNPGTAAMSPAEHRILDQVRRLPEEERLRLADRVSGWVEAMLEQERERRTPRY